MERRSEASPAALAAALQEQLQQVYRLEGIPAVGAFLRTAPPGEREALYVRYAPGGDLEIAVLAPDVVGASDLDGYCQLIEGVSHFVYLAERARRALPLTQLELELQAEIDKYVVLALLPSFEAARARALHVRLYEQVRFVDPLGTESGDRYRLANDLAARFVRRIALTYAAHGRWSELGEELVRFYRMGQSEKIERARAA